MDFHAHVYYDWEHRNEALALQAELKQYSQELGDLLKVYPLVDKLVGPHTMPMFEVDFSGQIYDDLISYLNDQHGNLPILIHPLTPDEIANHGVLARWIGQELPINWDRLRGAA